jgi:transposase InsO family protein
MMMYDHKVELPIDRRTGDQHILTIVEVLSGFTWAYPCKTLTADELVATLSGFYSSLPCLPKKVFLDNGSNFVSEKHKKLLENLKIELIFGTPGLSRARGKLKFFFFLSQKLIFRSC